MKLMLYQECFICFILFELCLSCSVCRWQIFLQQLSCWRDKAHRAGPERRLPADSINAYSRLSISTPHDHAANLFSHHHLLERTGPHRHQILYSISFGLYLQLSFLIKINYIPQVQKNNC